MNARNLIRQRPPTLTEIDTQLDRYPLTPEHRTRARSLAAAGAASATLGITPAELFAIIAPAFHKWEREQGSGQ